MGSSVRVPLTLQVVQVSQVLKGPQRGSPDWRIDERRSSRIVRRFSRHLRIFFSFLRRSYRNISSKGSRKHCVSFPDSVIPPEFQVVHQVPVLCSNARGDVNATGG